jgi:hypothetical protein
MTFQPVFYEQKLKFLEAIVNTDMKFFKKNRDFKHLPQCSTETKKFNKKAKSAKSKKRASSITESKSVLLLAHNNKRSSLGTQMEIIKPTARLEPMAPHPTVGYLPIGPSALLNYF